MAAHIMENQAETGELEHIAAELGPVAVLCRTPETRLRQLHGERERPSQF